MHENEMPLSVNQEDDTDAKGCIGSWRETLVVSGSFMAAYTAYLTIQNLQSSLNQEAGLGVVSLACVYGTVILSGILAPSFIRLVGAKGSLAIAWVCHTLYTACNFYPSWATLIPASILLGSTAGPQWTAASLYITTSGERIAQKSGRNLHAILSQLNGVLYMSYESSQIAGNLISSLVLKQGSYSESDNVTRTCGADDCPTAGNATEIAEPEPYIVYILLSIFLVFDVIALLLTLILLPPLRESSKNRTEKKQLSKVVLSWFSALKDPKLLCLVPVFMQCTMSHGILVADYTKSFISCVLGVSMVGFIMASNSAATSLVALVTSRAARYSGRHVLFGLALTFNVCMLLTLLLWKPQSNDFAWFFIVPVLYGMVTGILFTQMSSLVGLMFPEKKESALANFHTWNATGYTITFAYGGVLCVRTKLYITVSVVVLGALGYTVAEILYARQIKTARSDDILCKENKNIMEKELL